MVRSDSFSRLSSLACLVLVSIRLLLCLGETTVCARCSGGSDTAAADCDSSWAALDEPAEPTNTGELLEPATGVRAGLLCVCCEASRCAAMDGMRCARRLRLDLVTIGCTYGDGRSLVSAFDSRGRARSGVDAPATAAAAAGGGSLRAKRAERSGWEAVRGRKEVVRSALNCCGGGGGASLPVDEVEEAVEGASGSGEPVGWRRRPPMAGRGREGSEEGTKHGMVRCYVMEDSISNEAVGQVLLCVDRGWCAGRERKRCWDVQRRIRASDDQCASGVVR